MNVIVKEVHKECCTGEEVLHKKMVKLPHQSLCQQLDNTPAQAKVNTPCSSPSVDLEMGDVAVVALKSACL